MLEALSAGLPVITSKCGGISEWITDETGILVEEGDEEGLAESMKKVKDNYERFRFDAIEDKIKMCSYESVGKQFLELYQKALVCD